jgi:hypothetical protein
MFVRTTDTFHTDTKQQIKLWFCVCLSLDFQNFPVVYENTPSLARSKNDTQIYLALARINIFLISHHTSDLQLLPKKGGGGGKVTNILQLLLCT